MAKKSKKIIQCLNSGIFPCKVMFSVGFTYKEIVAYLKKSKANDWAEAIKDDEAHVNGGKYHSMRRYYNGATYFYVIITRQFDFSDWDMIMLAHEFVHTCQFMLPDILNRDNETECEAYLHTHLMTQALQHLRK